MTGKASVIRSYVSVQPDQQSARLLQLATVWSPIDDRRTEQRRSCGAAGFICLCHAKAHLRQLHWHLLSDDVNVFHKI